MTAQGSARAASRLDPYLPGPLLVVGSLPPQARDLDLLVPEQERAGVEAALRRAGFLPQGQEWVAGPDEVVELLRAEDWGLPAEELQRLREQARAIPGLVRLVRPAPSAGLLVLARQLPLSGRLEPKRRRRAEQALVEDPSAWDGARAAAPAWAAGASLALLRASYDGRSAWLARLLAAREQLGRQNVTAGLPLARAVFSGAGRRPLPVVAISGLDGAGKSTQARLLAAALQDVGYDVVVQWNRLSYNRSLLWLTAPVRLVLKLVGSVRGPFVPPYADARHEVLGPEFAVPEEHSMARGLRERLPGLTAVWALLVALTNGVPMGRDTRREVARGRVVLRDRYLLDSLVHLEDRYGTLTALRVQRAVLRRLAPPPLAAFLLDVPAQDAYDRKPEEHTVAALEVHRDLYLRAAAQAEVTVLDGRLPAEDLTRELRTEVLKRLGEIGWLRPR